MDDFEPLEWVREFTGAPSLAHEHLQPVLHFTLVWSLFEELTCNTNASLPRIMHAADEASPKLSAERYAPFLDFFSTRYSRQLWVFRLKKDEDRDHVNRVLTEGASDDVHLVKALLKLAHRVRNNLFHGEKSVIGLPAKGELLGTATHLLATFLEDHRAATTPRRPRTSA